VTQPLDLERPALDDDTPDLGVSDVLQWAAHRRSLSHPRERRPQSQGATAPVW
jgi:hypothetical protein